MAFEEIYGLLMEDAVLIEKHKMELITKRGFNQETIKKFRFGSGGQHLLTFEESMMRNVIDNKFREQDLVASGVFIHDGKNLRLNPILLRETSEINGKEFSNVIIPYINSKDEVYLVRPHKMGLGGVPVEVYQEKNISDDPAEIILTEGEFKAVAGMQFGFPTIAVPGISSFSEKKFPELVKLLNNHKVRRITIIFDNETKNDQNFPNYKDNPYDRYDTEFYAYYMATRLEKEGKEVFVGTLPNGWKMNGKIDIDGASAQGKTSGEMKKIVYDSKIRTEFLADLPDEAKQQVLRKNNQKYHRSKIKKEFNRYVVTRHRGKNTFDEPISNFVMRIIATHETPDGIKREIDFVNVYGKHSYGFTIGAKDMSSADNFRSFAISKGDFIWRGTIEDLLTIWESEFLMMDEGRYIVESDHLGWIEREKMWLFGNIAIHENGTELRPDKNNIFWLDKRGIKPIPISITTGRNVISEGIPHMYLGIPIDPNEIMAKMSDTIGINETCMLMGWIASTAFMDEIFHLYRSFPFLFVTGRWQSGKSTIAEWVTNFFGIEEAGKSISQTTAVAIQRSLAYYSCLPVYLDEYRNTKEIKFKDGFLRNVYNRQGAGKGVKEDFGLRDAKVRGTLIVAGEETPKDGALQSRCIVIFVSVQKRIKNHFNWFMANRIKFSGHFLSILKNKKNTIKTFFEAVTKWKDFFIQQGINDRMALNYATIVAGHIIIFGEKNIEFTDWLTTETKSIQVEHNEEQAVSVFMDDLMAMKTRRLIDDNYWATDDDRVYIYFHGLHNVWSQEYRKSRGEEAFKESSIRAYMKEEHGFLESNVNWRIKGSIKKCIVFDRAKVSDEIKHLIEHVEPVVAAKMDRPWES